jgi:hypothetical protein
VGHPGHGDQTWIDLYTVVNRCGVDRICVSVARVVAVEVGVVDEAVKALR